MNAICVIFVYLISKNRGFFTSYSLISVASIWMTPQVVNYGNRRLNCHHTQYDTYNLIKVYVEFPAASKGGGWGRCSLFTMSVYLFSESLAPLQRSTVARP